MARPRVFVTRVVAQEALGNVIITPHIASARFATRKNMALMVAENLLAGLRGQAPPNCVNPEALKGQGFSNLTRLTASRAEISNIIANFSPGSETKLMFPSSP